MFNFNEGALVPVNKPEGMTSFGVVKKVKWITKAKKVGHAGTLDPLAEGLLLVCTGKFTKEADRYQAMPKEYTGIFYVGASRPSYDRETEIDAEYPTDHISEEMIHDAALSMTGTLDQVPPVFSAIKVNGQRAYKKARSGEELVLKSRQIQIYAFEITSIALPYVHFRVECSKGTYIRSLAHDFGKKLDSGAYLEKLVRTRIGEHRLEDAYQLPQFEQWVKSMQQNEGH